MVLATRQKPRRSAEFRQLPFRDFWPWHYVVQKIANRRNFAHKAVYK